MTTPGGTIVSNGRWDKDVLIKEEKLESSPTDIIGQLNFLAGGGLSKKILGLQLKANLLGLTVIARSVGFVDSCTDPYASGSSYEEYKQVLSVHQKLIDLQTGKL